MDIPDDMVLLCPSTEPRCTRDFEVSPEDPDSTLSDVVRHLTGYPHHHDRPAAMELLAKVQEAPR